MLKISEQRGRIHIIIGCNGCCAAVDRPSMAGRHRGRPLQTRRKSREYAVAVTNELGMRGGLWQMNWEYAVNTGKKVGDGPRAVPRPGRFVAYRDEALPLVRKPPGRFPRSNADRHRCRSLQVQGRLDTGVDPYI